MRDLEHWGVNRRLTLPVDFGEEAFNGEEFWDLVTIQFSFGNTQHVQGILQCITYLGRPILVLRYGRPTPCPIPFHPRMPPATPATPAI
jgi:hypothetical protein